MVRESNLVGRHDHAGQLAQDLHTTASDLSSSGLIGFPSKLTRPISKQDLEKAIDDNRLTYAERHAHSAKLGKHLAQPSSLFVPK